MGLSDNMRSILGKGRFIASLVVLMVFILSSVSFALDLSNLSGLIQLTYQKDKYTDPGTTSEKSSFIQEYKLEYRDFMYNPKLLRYTIGGAFRKDIFDTKGPHFGETSVRAKNLDYNFKLDVLQGTRYPFMVFKEKLDAPSTTIQPDLTVLTKQEIDRTGLSGNAFFLSDVSLRYDLHQDAVKITGLTEEDRTNRFALIGIDRRRENEIIDLSYNYQNNFDKILNETETIHDGRVSVWLKPGQLTDINIDTYYNNNSLSEIKTVSSNVKANYTPSTKFNANVSVYTTGLKQGEDSGNFETFFSNTTERFGEFFTASQNMMLYRSAGDFGNENIESMTFDFNYSRPLFYGLSFVLSPSLNATAEQSDVSENRNSWYYNVGGNVSKLFEGINTSINAGGLYYGYSNSRNGSQTRYELNGGFNSRLIRNITLQNTTTYYVEDVKGDMINGVPSSMSKKDRLTTDSSIAYFVRVGLRGSLDARLGAIFSTENDQVLGASFKRNFQYTDCFFKYALRRNLLLSTGIRLYKESINNTTTISGSANVEYRLKGLYFKYVNELWQEKSLTGDRIRATSFLQASRPF